MFVVPVPVLSLWAKFGRLVLVVVMVLVIAVGGGSRRHRRSLLNSSIQRRSHRHRGATTCPCRTTPESIGKVLV